MSVDPHAARQKGFSLPEVLIAAVIAAGVLAAAAQMLGGSVRLTHATSARSDTLLAAQTIAARLRAEMDDNEALVGFDGWRIERVALPREGAGMKSYFDRVTIETKVGPRFRLQFLAKTTDRGAR